MVIEEKSSAYNGVSESKTIGGDDAGDAVCKEELSIESRSAQYFGAFLCRITDRNSGALYWEEHFAGKYGFI